MIRVKTMIQVKVVVLDSRRHLAFDIHPVLYDESRAAADDDGLAFLLLWKALLNWLR